MCDTYELLPVDNYKLPPEAEGLEPAEEVKAPALSILKPDATGAQNLSTDDFLNVGRTNTRRHIRQSPSVGSAVTTVLEADEDDPDVTRKLNELHIRDDGEDVGPAEIPVIVDAHEVDADDEASPKEASPEVAEPEVAEPEVAEPVESQSIPHDDAGAASSTTSWDRMSSESVEEKPEATETVETAAEEEHAEESVEKDVAPAEETSEPEANTDPEIKDEVKEDAPAEKTAVEEETTKEES